jgi:NADH:ubiquinone oxidoreductase subunit 5 (subunit L)/multisubunit Na+/H+ antiporter MnhA subunit
MTLKLSLIFLIIISILLWNWYVRELEISKIVTKGEPNQNNEVVSLISALVSTILTFLQIIDMIKKIFHKTKKKKSVTRNTI